MKISKYCLYFHTGGLTEGHFTDALFNTIRTFVINILCVLHNYLFLSGNIRPGVISYHHQIKYINNDIYLKTVEQFEVEYWGTYYFLLSE